MAVKNKQNGWVATLSHPAFKPVALSLSAALMAASIVLVLVQVRATIGVAPGSSTATSNAGGTIAAYVVGAVNHPGVYHLATTARMQDLIAAAGGALPDADLVRVNLAAPLFDGEEAYIPRIGEAYPVTTNAAGVLVNINLASATTLHTQLGLTTKTASAIVTYRQQHGPFTAIDQLLLVPISRAIYDRIKDLVSI